MANRFRQFRLLLWKNFILQIRRPIGTVFELLLPVLLLGVLILPKVFIKPENLCFSTYEPTTSSSIRETLFSPLLTNKTELAELVNANISEKLKLFYKIQQREKNNTRVAYYPSSPLIENLMNQVGNTTGVTIIHTAWNSEDEMAKEASEDEYFGAFVFDISKDETQLPKQVKYSIRLPHNVGGFRKRWRTEATYPNFQAVGPRNDFQCCMGYRTRFIQLQYALDMAIIQTHTNLKDKIPLNVQQFPYPSYTQNLFMQTVQGLMPLLMTLAFMYSAVMIIKELVNEKHARLKESMKMMGLANWIHWLAWFTKNLLFLLVSIAIATLLLKVFKIFEFSDGFLIFVFLLMYIVASIMFCFFISVFFSRPVVAMLFGAVAWYCSLVPYQTFAQQEAYEALSRAEKAGSCLLPNTCLGIAVLIIARFEIQEVGMTWDRVSSSPSPDDDFSFAWVLGMLVIQSLVYGILTWDKHHHSYLLEIAPHTPTPEPVQYDKKDGQWYTHDGVDVKDTQQRKALSTTLDSSNQDINSVAAAGGNNREYLDLAKRGGGHTDLLTVEPHIPTPEPVQYDKKDGQWYSHDGVDIKDTQQRKEFSTTLDSSSQDIDSVAAAGGNNREYLELAKQGGGHTDLLTKEDHTPTAKPTEYDKKDGQWYTHDGVDVKDTQQRKELSTILDSSIQDIENAAAAGGNSREYLELAKRGGGHTDLLTVEPHTPTPEPVQYDKKDGQWYTHDGVDVKDTQQRKEFSTTLDSSSQDIDSVVPAGGNNREYIELAKKGGGHTGLLTKEDHTPTAKPTEYDKKDGQWYTHDGVDVKDSQQRKEMYTSLDRSSQDIDSVSPAGGNNREYLELAKRGGGHTDLLTVEPHIPTPEPVQYDKKDGQWYTHDGVDIKDTQKRKELSTILDSSSQDIDSVAAAGGNNREYIELAKRGGGHTGLLTKEDHMPTAKPVEYDKKDGQWYTHDGVDVKDTQQRKEMCTTLDRSSQDIDSVSPAGGNDREYLELAKRGGGHRDLLMVEPHTPTPEPVKYDKKDGQWYTHDGVDIKDTQKRKELSTILDSSNQDIDSVSAAGGNNREYLELAKKGGGHTDLLTKEDHTPTAKPTEYDKKDGQWYTHDGVDVKDTLLRKELSTTLDSSVQDIDSVAAAGGNNREYLELAKRGGGHTDLLEIVAHTPTSEPVRYDKKDGQWYTHDGVDVKDTQKRKELSTILDSSNQGIDSVVPAGGNNREYVELAKRGGGHTDLLTVKPHTPTPEPVQYDKKDGQWYTHDGVDLKDTQQRKDMSLVLNGSFQDTDCVVAAGGKTREYLDVAKKGGGHRDLLTIEDHTPSPEPQKYEKKGGDWYNQDDMETLYALQDQRALRKRLRTCSDSTVGMKCETEYLQTARKGGGHKDLLTIDPNTPTPEPKPYDKTDGQWYTHDGVDIKETQERKEMLTVSNRSRPSTVDSSVDVETDTDYLKIAKKGGGHKDLLTVKPHTPTPEPMKYDKKDGQWYTHDGVDLKDTQKRKELSTILDSSNQEIDSVSAAGGNNREYLELAKQGGGHKDLLTVEPHTPTAKPVVYDKTDGQWYTHDGVDIKDTQKRKELSTILDSSVQDIENAAAAGGNNREYVELAKRGGGHKDLLTVEPHTPTPEPVQYDKKDGQWYTHDGGDIKDTQQRKELSTILDSSSQDIDSVAAAGGNNREYLKLAKQGGGHTDLLTKEDHTPTAKPTEYDKKDGQWYTHDGVDIKDTLQRKELSTTLDSSNQDIDSVAAAGGNNREYVELAKKGGGHKDLLTVEPHTPTREPVQYDKKDGQWYTHDGVDVKDTQQKKELFTILDSSSQDIDSVAAAGGNNREYLDLAKRGGGHTDLLTKEDHTPTAKPVEFDKKDGQWYTHDGVDIKDTQQRKDLTPRQDTQPDIDSVSAAGGNNREYLELAKKGGGHKDLLEIVPHTPTAKPVQYDKTDGQWYTHDGVDVKDTQQRKDISMTVDGARQNNESLSAAGENNGQYLEMAKKGGHKDLLTIEDHTPTAIPVAYDKKDGQWYTHDGVDVKDTQQRKEMVTVSDRPRTSSTDRSLEVETDTDYLKTAKKGGGHKDLLMIEPNTPNPERVQFDKKDGQWYTHDGVDIKDTQQRKEMVTVSDRPRPSTADSSLDVETDTDYLKCAKKGGGHKDLLTVKPHTPTPEPVQYDKTDGQWYTHDGVDIKDTQQKKEMPTIPGSPRHSDANTSVEIDTNTHYLKMAKQGGGHTDLLTIKPHTPSSTPQTYERKGGDWYNQDDMETLYGPQDFSTPRKLRRTYSDSAAEAKCATEYLRTARKGGGHKDLLTMEPHTPSPQPKRIEKQGGDWYYHGANSPVKTPASAPIPASPREAVDSPDTSYHKLARKGDDRNDRTTPRSPRRTTSDSKIAISGETEYLKTARKGGGHRDLLTIEPHTPSPEAQRYEKKGGDWYSQASADRKRAHNKDVPTPVSPRRSDPSMRVSSETEYLKTAKKGGGHKDLLTMEPHKPSPRPKKQGRRLGDWYYQDGTDGKESLEKKVDSPALSSPRKTNGSSPQGLNDTEYTRMARKGGGHKDLLTISPHQASPRPKEGKRNGYAAPTVSSLQHSFDASKEATDYFKLSRKTSGQSERGTVDSPQSRAIRSAPPSTSSEYLSLARKGGHHRDLLTMPENNNNNNNNDINIKASETPRSSRGNAPNSQPLSWSVQVDGPPRPRTADYRQPHPIWLGGTGPERVHSPGKRFINQGYGSAPFAVTNDGSPGAAKNPDKI